MNRIYPERNPFPHEASLIIDSVEADLGVSPTGRAVSLPTLLLPPVQQLHDMIRRYFGQYDPAARGKGLPVALHGDHGTGKTHAIRYTMSLVASGELRPSAGGLQPYQLYARAETTDFMEIYRQLVHQVPLAMLRDLTLRFLGVVGSEIYGASMSSEMVGERATQIVIQEPEVINRAFREYLVGESEAKFRQAEEIQRAAGKEENFQNVIGYLLRDDLAETAYRWLAGEIIEERDLKKLGVTALIQTPALARWGLRFLATIFGRGGRPLIIYIDQYEKLVLSLDGTLVSENCGIIRALVDEIREASAMLVFAGNHEAWQAISQIRDLRQRFGGNVIEFPVLTYDNASRLISLYLSLGRNHLLEVWPLKSGKEMIQLRGHASPIRAIVALRDGRRVISASKDSTIKIWSLENQEPLGTLYGHQGAVNALAVAPDQRRLVSGGDDHMVRVWDIENYKELYRLVGHENWVNAVVVAPDGRYAYSGSSDLTIRTWDLESGGEVRVMRGHRDTIWSLAITPDGKTLVSASADGTLRVWDLPGGELRHILAGHTAWVNTIEVTPDGKRVVSGSDDRTIRVWDLENGQALSLLTGHDQPVRALSVLPDGDRLVSAAVGDTYILWDLKGGSLLETFRRPTHSICAFTVLPKTPLRLVSAFSEQFQEGSEEIYPFEEKGVQAMLRNGGGNVRKLLQMCATAFEMAFPEHEIIGDKLVEKMLRKEKRVNITNRLVMNEIEKLISERSLSFTRSYKVGASLVDFAVLAPDGVPHLLVKLSEALFFKEEADHALSSVDLINQVRQKDLPAQVILVVLGYASPQVTDLLRSLAHETIVYEPENFALKFGGVLDRLKTSLPVVSTPRPDIDALQSDLNKVREALDQIATTRSHETLSLEEQLKKILSQQSLAGRERVGENARLLWNQERRQIEERIREVRKSQQKTDLEELERLHSKAAAEANQRRIWMAGIMGLFGLVLGFSLVFVIAGEFYLDFLTTALTAGLFLMVVLAAGSAIRSQFSQPRRLRELASEVTSIEELNRLVRAAVISVPEKERGSSYVGMLLHNSNPHLRFAGALAADPQEHRILLVEALLAERSSIVRRVIARQLANLGEKLEFVFDEVSFETTPELAYLVESAAARKSLEPGHLRRMPVLLQTLAVIAARPLDYGRYLVEEMPKSRSLAFELAYAELEDFSRDLSGSGLGQAFQTGLSGDLSYLEKITEPQIQNAMRELSPFEEGGLGTFDSLENISKIDQYYIFFRQLAFYKENGLLAALPTP